MQGQEHRKGQGKNTGRGRGRDKGKCRGKGQGQVQGQGKSQIGKEYTGEWERTIKVSNTNVRVKAMKRQRKRMKRGETGDED